MKLIRTMLLAAVAALAMTASVGATSASASGFASDKYPAVVTGTSELPHGLSFSAVAYECSGIGFAAELEAASLSLLPYSTVGGSCSSAFYGKALMKTKECKLIFHPGPETSPGQFKGTFDIGPAGCGPIVLEFSTCERIIPSQTGLLATYKNEGSGSKATVTINVNTGFAYTPTGPATCGTSGQGSWEGSLKVSATTAVGEPTGIHVDQTGLYMAGKGSESKAEQPRFDAEAFPLSVVGVQDGSDPLVLTRTGRKISCKVVDFSQKAVSAPASSLSLGALYEGCSSSLGGPATIAMNGCQYVLSVSNVGPPYEGGASISCPNEKAITVTLFVSEKNYKAGTPSCVYQVGPQANLGGVGYSTVGEGSERAIDVDLELAGITSTRTLGSTLLCGSPEDKSATYTGSATLYGVS